ncbi:glycosyltransferase family 4 protein [Achromobacter spanius]|uniref:glycosyltransferase family 4 protein n=1 Tax=Achromobacter spanius TaxID=217203 RepID=UPI00320B7886
MNVGILKKRSESVLRFRRDHGTKALILRVLNALLNPDAFKKQKVVESLAFTKYQPFGERSKGEEAASNTVNWFIPRPGRGSGGHLNIFRFVRNLEAQGFECRLISTVTNIPGMTPEQMEMDIANWFFPLKAKVYIGAESAPPAAISIATGWHTAYDVRNFQSTLHKCYFVQDFEPHFYPVGTDYALAEETYRFGFTGITAGGWLATKLAADYGMRAYSVGFSYDRDLYRPMPVPHEGRRVFFYTRPSTPRRGFELGLAVLAEVARRHPDVVAVLAGGRLGQWEIPFKHVDSDIVDLGKLSELYNSCDVALVLSFTNLSLLPLELMACGVPVVSNRDACTQWLLTDENARLESPTIDALADAICSILEDASEAARLREGGLRLAASTDWAIEGNRMAEILRRIADQPESATAPPSMAAPT